MRAAATSATLSKCQMASLVSIARDLRRDTAHLEFGLPVAYVYRPLDYAWAPHAEYLRRYGSKSPREVLLVGMNPGPFGMAQTGVPFGEVAMVRDWLGIAGPVRQPARVHPRRPIQGFACTRSEVSGRRLWAVWRSSLKRHRLERARSASPRHRLHRSDGPFELPRPFIRPPPMPPS